MQISKDVVAYLRSRSKEPSGNTKLIEILLSVTQEEMEYIMRCYMKPEKQTVFFKACVTQPLVVVDYLLQNCKPNVNDKCYFYNHDVEEAVFDAFPLWYAARKGNLELVKLLIQHGADVNAKTRSGSTAIHAACLENNFEIIKILGDAGADVGSEDNESSTCLMAISDMASDMKIMEYILNKGVDVNVRETAGNKATALHYAISTSGGTLPKVKALVEAGADMTIPDKNGYQPFVFAAIAGKTDAMMYLLEKNVESDENKFKAHVLLAASIINNGYEDEGLEQLRAAYDLLPEGYEHPEVDEHITHFFPTVRVPRTSSDVMQLPNDEKALQAVAILLASQHIAIESDFIISALHFYVELFRDENDALSLSMCSFVYNSILSRKEWFHGNVEECICLYVCLLGRMCLERTPVSSDLQSEFDSLMNRLTNHIIMASKEEKFTAREHSNACSVFQYLLIALLYLVNICIKCHLRDKNLKSYLRRLARVNPQTLGGESLLHMLVDKFTLGYYHHYPPIDLRSLNPQLDLDVISCLVEQGFPLDTQDTSGKTPLSYVLTHPSSSFPVAPEDIADENRRREIIGRYFLEKGAHPDVQSNVLNRDVPVLEDYNIPPVNYLTLKCLAANTVVRHNFPYHEVVLPAEVKSFIDLHAPYKQYENHILHESLD